MIRSIQPSIAQTPITEAANKKTGKASGSSSVVNQRQDEDNDSEEQNEGGDPDDCSIDDYGYDSEAEQNEGGNTDDEESDDAEKQKQTSKELQNMIKSAVCKNIENKLAVEKDINSTEANTSTTITPA